MSYALLHVLLALFAAPLMMAVINRVKAFFGGRCGPSLFQPYYDLYKLLRKGAVYSHTTSWVFRASPIIGLSVVLTSLLLIPLGTIPALCYFPGDFIVLAYLLGLMRFLTVIAALDTGSAFEGMGASREVQFSALAEVSFLVAFCAASARFHSFSLSTLSQQTWTDETAWSGSAALLLVSTALFIVLLVENARIPFDDPNTHLELTMIHEVMILDHGGVDLAFIEYASALKLWILSTVLVSLALPVWSEIPILNLIIGVGAILVLAVVIGVIESTMARLRLLRVPQLLVTSSILSFLAVVMAMR